MAAVVRCRQKALLESVCLFIGSLTVPDVDPLEQMLIEHPSMSVYPMRCAMNEEEEEKEPNTDKVISRSVLRRSSFSERLLPLATLNAALYSSSAAHSSVL